MGPLHWPKFRGQIFFTSKKYFNFLSSKTWIQIRIHQEARIRIQWFRIGNSGLGRPTDGIAGWRRLEAHGLPVGGLDVLEVVRVRLLVVTVLLDLLLEQAHRVPSRRLEERIRLTRYSYWASHAKYYLCCLLSIVWRSILSRNFTRNIQRWMKKKNLCTFYGNCLHKNNS